MKDNLICIGLTTLDVVARPVAIFPEDALALVDEAVIAPAGTAAGTAYIAATLGVRTSLASLVGCDAVGRSVRMLLQERGVDTQLLAEDPALPTSTTLILVRPSGERTRFHAMGASRVMTRSNELKEAVGNARFVHYAAIGAAASTGLIRIALCFLIACIVAFGPKGARDSYARYTTETSFGRLRHRAGIL